MTTITHVTTAVVQANFDYTYARIHTDAGIHGTGEAFFAPGGPSTIRDLGELLVGHDPTRIRALTERLTRGAGGTANIGMAFHAISGLEAALWDLNGKLADKPVVDILGGRFRDAVEVYADLHSGSELRSMDNVMRYREPFWSSADGTTQTGQFFWEAAEEEVLSIELIVERASEAIKAGFRRIKFDLDVFGTDREASDRSIGRREVDQIAEYAMALRDTVGDEVEIGFDCHWRFDVPAALSVAQAVAPMSPMWLEDPVPPSARALAFVAQRSPVPIATGENVFRLEGFLDLVESRSAHILTPDAQKTGGLAETLRIADYAALHFIPIAPHCIASPLGLMAAAHVCAAAQNLMCLEFHGIDVPFWNDLVGRDVIRDGSCLVPDAPGIGVELDIDVVRAYSAPGEAIFGEDPS